MNKLCKFNKLHKNKNNRSVQHFIESVLDASGLEPVKIGRLLNRVYSTFTDC